MFLQNQMNSIRLLFLVTIGFFTLSVVMGQTTPEKQPTKAQKLKERKAQADSLLQKAGISRSKCRAKSKSSRQVRYTRKREGFFHRKTA